MTDGREPSVTEASNRSTYVPKMVSYYYENGLKPILEKLIRLHRLFEFVTLSQ
jgi:hypothetical protein